MEEEEMTLSLYECLRAVGLQRHYSRFTSVGVCRAAHLSGLTMEDYPILGIRSMEDRTRFFHLVQMVKTLDLESLEYEDLDDDDTDGGNEGYAVMDSSITFYGRGDPDEDVCDDEEEKSAVVSKLNAASFSKPSRVRRRLDFNCETTDHNQKLFSHPVGTVHVYTSHNRNNEPGQGKEPAIPVQLEFETGSAVVCSCKGNNNHRLDVHSHQFDHHTGENTKPDIVQRLSMFSSLPRLSPKCVSSHKPKPRPATVASKRYNNKPFGHKDREGISRKAKVFTETSSNTASEHVTKPKPVYESKRTAGYNYGLPLSSPPASNKKQTGGQRISVCVRKRPLTRTECKRGEEDVVTTPSGECVIVHESKEAVDLTQYILQHKFYFDQVFGEESSNEEVYQRTTYPLVQHMLNGGKATCFAYGQTGAGKTHTMLGSSPGRAGLYALAVQDIFSHLSTTHMHSQLLVYVSFFEIYCGQLYDLLDHRKRLFAREDGQKVVHIAGLCDVQVDSVSSLLEVISQGTEERTQGMSGVNPLSSRSHALLQIQLRGPNQQIAGRMWFVDLAGSERASDTKEPDRQSRMEGADINQSLLALKECIRSLDQEQSHTPFRQSKLTQVLKDSFVGDSMTCMIANISPGHLATEHTLNTLRYADRVKELRGQGGPRGGRRGKTIPSPKHNLSNGNSSSVGTSVGTRGKSPPKKPKLGRQREAFGTTAPTSRFATGGAILCSTPKNSRWEEETSTRARKGIGLEQITPITGLLGIGDKRERRQRTGGREDGRRERYGGTDSAGHSIGDQNVGEGLVLEQATDEQLHLWETQGKSGFYNREKKNQRSTLKGGRQGERRWIEPRRQEESSRETGSEAERLRERGSQKVDDRDKERERHLRHYHQQLQQFMPSSASSEVEFRQDRGNSENRRSLKAIGEGEVIIRRKDWRPAGMEEGGERRWAWEATEETDRMTGARAADVEVLVSYNCDSDVGVEGLDASDVPADEMWSTQEQDGAAGYSLVSTHSNHGSLFNHPPVESPHQRAPAERPLSPACEHTNTLLTPNALGDLSLKLKHTRCTSNILPLPLQNAQQGVASSSCREKEPWFAANANRGEFSNTQSTTLPLTTSITQNGCKIHAEPLNRISENPAYTQEHNQPQVKVKIPVLAQVETSTNSLSYIMDPLGISLLQVDQQAAMASLLQGEHNKTSLCPLENERGEDKVEKECLPFAEMAGKVVEDDSVDLHLSFLELPQTKTCNPPTSDSMMATKHSEQRKDVCCATFKHCGIGMMKPPIPEVMLVSLQNEEENQKPQITPAIEVLDNKVPASPPKPFTCASVETSVMQSISSSVQHSGNTSSPSSHNLMTNGATQIPPEYAHNVHNKLPFSISTPQSESVLCQVNTLPKQCHTVHSNISCQPNGPTESNSEESTSNLQIRPIIHLSTLEDLYHSQWRVVQAHWEQLEEMETLCHKEGRLLCQQPDMAFGEYVQKLGEIMERKAQCVHSMIAQLQPYLNTNHSNQPQNQ